MESRTDQAFKWIWRANGLALLVLSIAGVVALALLVANVGLFAARERPEENVTEVAGTTIESAALRFGNFDEIIGTSLLYAPLGTESEYIGSGSSGGVANTRNLLFFDSVTKKAHWLLKGNHEFIHTYSFLTDAPGCAHSGDDSEQCEASRVAIALLLQIESEPAAAKKTGSTGSRRIAIAAVDGTDVRELVTGADGLRGVHSIDSTRTLVFYAKAGAVRVLDIDPRTRTLRSDEKLSAQD